MGVKGVTMGSRRSNFMCIFKVLIEDRQLDAFVHQSTKIGTTWRPPRNMFQKTNIHEDQKRQVKLLSFHTLYNVFATNTKT